MNKFIIISDTQAIVQINDKKITATQAKALSEEASRSFREGTTIILPPDFEVEDRRQLSTLILARRIEKLERLHDPYSAVVGTHAGERE